jgi:NADH:ubiquinone oxidoreductase subunit 5 (subunit L)/multisubunit Na+/H+ antiporter MnhA subunit
VVFDAIGFSELGREVYTSSIEWLATGTTSFNLGVLVDPLTVAMLFMVPHRRPLHLHLLHWLHGQ